MEMEIGRDNVVVDYDDDSLCEAIDLHNDHVDKMMDFCRMLIDRFGEEDPIIDEFLKVFNSASGSAILLCYEANCREAMPVWKVMEDFHVVED